MLLCYKIEINVLTFFIMIEWVLLASVTCLEITNGTHSLNKDLSPQTVGTDLEVEYKFLTRKLCGY